MKEINKYFRLLLLGFGIVTLIGLSIPKTSQNKQERTSKFEQSHQKVQYFDSLSQVYTDQSNLSMMINCRDSMMYYFGEMIKNLKEE